MMLNQHTLQQLIGQSAFPNSNHGVPAFGQIGVARGVSFTLSDLLRTERRAGAENAEAA